MNNQAPKPAPPTQTEPAQLAPAETASAQPAIAPTLPLMHCAFVLTGLGTMLLGPILPLLTQQFHLADAQTGLLILAQFLGATLGGASTSHRLRSGLTLGLVCATAGFFTFAIALALHLSLYAACACLFVAGSGVGRVITVINIMAGARYSANRGAALSWLNFSWSFGALLSPLSAAWLASRFVLWHLLAAFAAAFLVVAVVFFLQSQRDPAREAATAAKAPGSSLRPALFLYFAILLVLYGGLETSLSAWLTTYALRYGKTSLVLSEYTMVLFLCGLTAGRAAAARLLRYLRDATLQRVSLLLAAGLIALLARAHSAELIATYAVILGVFLAPIFPATFAIVLEEKPAARQAGMILAASGIGAAALPWAMGQVSTASGSLQLALILPAAAAAVMFALGLHTPRNEAKEA